MTAPYTISTATPLPEQPGHYLNDQPVLMYVDDEATALRLFRRIRGAYTADVHLYLYDPADQPITHALGTRRPAR